MDKDEMNQRRGPDENHIKILNETFKIENFKPEQWEMINSLMYERRDSFIIAGAAFGKSLIFQFPAVFLKKIVLVISPLISLMEDQVLSLERKGIRAHLLTPETCAWEVDLSEFQIIYMTPELFTLSKGKSRLKEIKEEICLVAIDECQCITQWGFGFRKAYRQLYSIKKFLPGIPLVCLSATATDYCIRDVAINLALVDPLIVRAELNRPNLEFHVSRKGNSFVEDVKKYLSPTQKGSAIIYVLRQRDADNYSGQLQRQGFQCQAYHGGIGTGRRQQILKSFINGTLRFIVATTAFGMGIDRSDVRAVIHYGSPKNIESYFQDSGVAGRDGGAAKCVIFWEPKDFEILRYFLKSDSDFHRSKNLSQEMEKFLTSTSCRRLEILSHFIQSTPEFAIRENCCDNCTTKLHKLIPLRRMYKEISKGGWLDLSDDIRILLSGVKAYKGQCNENSFLGFLMGKLPSSANRNHPLELFAKGKNKPKVWWSYILKIIKKRKMVQQTMIQQQLNPRGRVPDIARDANLKISKYGNKFLIRKAFMIRVKPTNEILPLLTKTNREFYIENSVIKSKPRIPYDNKAKAPEKKMKQETDNLLKVEIPRVLITSLMKLEKVNDGAGCSSWIKPEVKIEKTEAPTEVKIEKTEAPTEINIEKTEVPTEEKIEKTEAPIMKQEDRSVKGEIPTVKEEVEEVAESLKVKQLPRRSLRLKRRNNQTVKDEESPTKIRKMKTRNNK